MRASEANGLRLSMAACATRAWRLRARAEGATGGRRAMLQAMSEAYIAFGLAKSHMEHGSSDRVVADLLSDGYKLLEGARRTSRGGGTGRRT